MWVLCFALVVFLSSTQALAGPVYGKPASSSGSPRLVGKGIDITATKNKVTNLSSVNTTQNSELGVLASKIESEEASLLAIIARLQQELSAASDGASSQSSTLSTASEALTVAHTNNERIAAALAVAQQENAVAAQEYSAAYSSYVARPTYCGSYCSSYTTSVCK